MKKYYIIALILALCLAYKVAYGEEWSNKEIAQAIYMAEGAEKAVKPFGILSVPCEGYDSCRQICLNTVRNNRKRYKDYGHKDYPDFISFLSSRYAPVGASNDPQGLNKNWLSNVLFYLRKYNE